jgi:ABC-type multidrug transport system ATPase subunit
LVFFAAKLLDTFKGNRLHIIKVYLYMIKLFISYAPISLQRPNLRKAETALSVMSSAEEAEDVDVRTARDEMKERCEAYIKRHQRTKSEEAEINERKFAIEMFALRKTYTAGGIFKRKKIFAAVAGNSFGIREGECFCLLGPNGAGKTTSIHCLTGVLPFSAGDALIYGTSIATSYGLDQVRPLMGVCPQFDTGLWELLSGREHLHLFGSIKGIPASAISSESARLLEDVKLTEAADITAGAYSGGMKRRLSVALALLGNPKVCCYNLTLLHLFISTLNFNLISFQIVYLDEPTTGLDPISRRHLWDLVDSAKQNRAIVLTTHSMEEADILGDRIGIMVRGKLQCVGTSLRLKSRYGSGYRVSVRVHAGLSNFDDQKTRIKSLFMTRLGVKSGEHYQTQ